VRIPGAHWDDVTEFPILGNREVWEFENPTNSYHPMHVHLVRFQIVGKTDLNTGQLIPLQPWEINTWKDIVHIPANTKARIIMDFEDYAGRFPNHCHLLDHEDHEMMRQFQATYDPAYCNNDGTCDPGEDCQSCPNDCAQVSGASCGNGLCEAGDGENCLTCPADCAGKQTGSASKQFCCGFDDGQVTNPPGWSGCYVDVDGDDGVVLAGVNDIDVNGDGFIDGEQTEGTDPKEPDTDGDQLEDGLEVANGASPLDPNSWPNLADGDCAPYDAPNNQLDGGDLVVAMRLALGLEMARPLELAHCDLGTPDGVINVADVLLLIQLLQSQ
jgi:hypothetical protein